MTSAESDDPKLWGHSPSPSPPAFSENWREKILIPTILAGIGGAGVGSSLSKHRQALGVPRIAATYAANFAIVAGFYCGAREYVRVARKSDPDDLLNSAAAGFGTGAILGRLQGGPLGAIKYSVAFAIAGTVVDFATIKLRPTLTSLKEAILDKDSWLKLPEWSPIQVLDEEAMAAKEAREKQLYAQRAVGKLSKEES